MSEFLRGLPSSRKLHRPDIRRANKKLGAIGRMRKNKAEHDKQLAHQARQNELARAVKNKDMERPDGMFKRIFKALTRRRGL